MFSFLDKLEERRVFLPPVDEAKMKYLAVVVMLLDHVTYAFLERMYGANGYPVMFSFSGGYLLDRVGRAIGRQSFPIFCFFLVEGFLHTRSRIKYFLRLAVFAILSQFPFQICLFPRAKELHANVICTLCIGFLAIWVIHEMWKICSWNKKGEKEEVEESAQGPGGIYAQPVLRMTLFPIAGVSATAGFCRLATVLRTDYGMGGVILIVILYCLRRYRITSLFISWVWMTWYNRYELYAAPAFMLLACYNGQRGKQHKYFFYFFYPAHLFLIWAVRKYFAGY